jgi:SET and MYND domain-containing protein
MSRRQKPTLKAGEVILTSEPFAHVLKSEFQGSRCDWCLSTSSHHLSANRTSSRNDGVDSTSSSRDVMRCSGCKWVHYCGNVCQVAAWKSHHRWECLCLRRVAPKSPPDFVRLMAKILLRLQVSTE